MPRPSVTQHLQIHPRLSCVHVTDDPPVSVPLFPDDAHLLLVAQFSQRFTGLIAEWLRFLRCVDASEPDAVLDLIAVQNRQRVAVGYRDDLAAQFGGARW